MTAPMSDPSTLLIKTAENDRLMPARRTAVWKDEYADDLDAAVEDFWRIRREQGSRGTGRDTGSRKSVTGGRQMGGFAEIMKKVAIDAGVPEGCIFLAGSQIPGYFRPTKDWDLLIVSPGRRLVASFEFKSQVGSFGNNFNNRVEEALGSAVDLHTAFRERAFGAQPAPWLGYLLVVEKSEQSDTPVAVKEPHFSVMEEFRGTSYLDRYGIFCSRLMLERHYDSACMIWTSETGGMTAHGHAGAVSFRDMVGSYAGFLIGRSDEFGGR